MSSPTTDRRARFESIAAEVFDPIQRYVGRRVIADEAQDVFADVLLTIWRRIDDVPEENPLPWCYGVARRTLANYRRGEQRRRRLLERLASEPSPAPAAEPDADPELSAALATLSANDQELLRLWAWEQLEPREIALVLGTTANAVSLRLTRAKKKLAAAHDRSRPLPDTNGRDAEEQPDE